MKLVLLHENGDEYQMLSFLLDKLGKCFFNLIKCLQSALNIENKDFRTRNHKLIFRKLLSNNTIFF